MLDVRVRHKTNTLRYYKESELHTATCNSEEYYVVDTNRIRVLAKREAMPWGVTLLQLRKNCICPDKKMTIYDRALAGPYGEEYRKLFSQLSISSNECLTLYHSSQNSEALRIFKNAI